MKKRVIGLSLLAMAAGAHAQSSVTLYGRIDNGIGYMTGLPNGNVFRAQSGGWGESWWGLIGSEDLGGGNKAIFQLESGINTMSGGIQNGGLFGRHATVGLSNDNFGTFKLGNLGAGEMSQDSWDIDPQLMQQYAIATLVRGRNWAQTGNGFEYTSPTMSGLTLKGQYSLTNNPSSWNAAPSSCTTSSSSPCGTGPGQVSNGQGRTDAVKAKYTSGSFELLGIYDEVRSPDGKFDNVYQFSRSAIAGGTLTWGPLKGYLGYQHLSAPDATYTSYGITPGSLPGGATPATQVNHEWLGLAWQVNAAAAITGAIWHANANNGNGNATMYTLAGTYNLSKRTFLYTELAYVANSKTSNVGLGNGYSDPYGPNTNQGGTSSAPNYGGGQFGAIAGIMTQF
jgi:predicted porin